MSTPRTMRILFSLLAACTVFALVAVPAAAQESTPETTPAFTPTVTPAVTPESTLDFAPAQPIPAEELGDYTTGVRFTDGDVTWEFLSDIPGVEYVAETTDVAFLAGVLRTLIDANNPDASAFAPPAATTIRVAFAHDNAFSAPLSINNQFGLNAAQAEPDGVLLLRTPYNDTFVRGLHVDGTTEAMRVAFLHSVLFSQIYYASRAGLADAPGDDYYRAFLNDLGLPDVPSEEQIMATFRGLGMDFDPAVFADAATTTPAETSAPTATTENVVRIGTFNRTGNLRQAASTRSTFVASVAKGAAVTILSEEHGQVVTSYGITSTLWYRVRVDESGQEGYAWSGLIDVAASP